MSATNTTIRAGELSKRIVDELIAQELTDYANLNRDWSISGTEVIASDERVVRGIVTVEGSGELTVEGELLCRFLVVEGTVNDPGTITVTGESGNSLVDPNDPRRKAPFVGTSWPNQGADFPHLIVTEQDNQLSRITPYADLFEGPFVAQIQIEANNDTEKFRLKDALREFILTMTDDREWQEAGWSDTSIESVTSTTWDATASTTGLAITISGIAHVTP